MQTMPGPPERRRCAAGSRLAGSAAGSSAGSRAERSTGSTELAAGCAQLPPQGLGEVFVFSWCLSNALGMRRAVLQLAVTSPSCSALHDSCSPPCSQQAFSAGARVGLGVPSAAAGVQHLQMSFRSAGSGRSFHQEGLRCARRRLTSQAPAWLTLRAFFRLKEPGVQPTCWQPAARCVSLGEGKGCPQRSVSLWGHFGDEASTMMCPREPGPKLLGDMEQRVRGIMLSVCEIQTGTHISDWARLPEPTRCCCRFALLLPPCLLQALCLAVASGLQARLPRSGATGCHLAGSYQVRAERAPFLSWV